MSTSDWRVSQLVPPMLAMGIVILVSNLLVEIPVQATVAGIDLSQLLTYGAITYPVAFLVTDTTNRLFGARAARLVVYVGFLAGVVLSLALADPRIAAASGLAFLIAQSLDVKVFDRLRKSDWWKAPLISSVIGSVVDTALFFSIAFAGTGHPWIGWALGDLVVKLAMAMLLLPAFRALMLWLPARAAAENGAA